MPQEIPDIPKNPTYSKEQSNSSLKSSKRDKNKKKLTKAAIGAAILETIALSHSSSAFAECGMGSGADTCVYWTPDEFETSFCLPEDSTTTVQFDVETINDTYYYPVRAYFEELGDPTSGFSINPSGRSINGYIWGDHTNSPAPSVYRDTVSIDITTPPVDPTTPVDIDLEVTGYGDYYDTGWDDWLIDYTETFYISVEDLNSAPLTSTLADSDGTVPYRTATTDISVSADISDEESNSAEVVFELSDKSDFSNIVQTQTYSASLTTSTQKFNHTFTDLSHGKKYWRVLAVETDAAATCAGQQYEVDKGNLTVISAENFTITSETRFSGYLYSDTNKNGTKDANEEGVGGVTITITDPSGSQQITTYSEVNTAKLKNTVLASKDGTETGYFEAAVDPGTITIEVNQNDPNIPEGFYYNGRETFTATANQLTNAGYQPFVNDSLSSTGMNTLPFILTGTIFLAAVAAKTVAVLLSKTKQTGNHFA
jgi:hypothetical protein